MKRVVEVDVLLQQDEDGLFVASVPLLPGCHTQGGSRDEALRNVREAIELYLDSESLPSRRAVELVKIRVEA